MIDQAILEQALDDIRPGLDADGFRLRVGAVSAGEIEMVLLATPDACLDCLVPDQLIVGMIEDAVASRVDDLRSPPRIVLRKEGF